VGPDERKKLIYGKFSHNGMHMKMEGHGNTRTCSMLHNFVVPWGAIACRTWPCKTVDDALSCSNMMMIRVSLSSNIIGVNFCVMFFLSTEALNENNELGCTLGFKG